jgi:mannose-1-phosphate guanylyltransferase / mannose-6-phosphate isomerase
MLIPVILCGGVGSRLWPVSRDLHPKPFLRLPDGQTLLEKALRRAAALPSVQHIFTVGNAQFSFKIDEEYEKSELGTVSKTQLLEPVGRNTAAAIACAALEAQIQHPGTDPCLLVLAADHLILNQAAFENAVGEAQRMAQDGKIVTFGIRPTRPETGYGYIEAVGNTVKRFVEKPDLATAQSYVLGGNHLWNAGMFCFRASTMLQEMAERCPDILAAASACLPRSTVTSAPHKKQVALESDSFARIRDNSIDFEIMEKTALAAVVACDIGWSDIGSWAALGELTAPDANGNRVAGNALLRDTRNCFVQSSGRLVAALGVDNLTIIDTDDALLVASTVADQEVKHLYASLKSAGSDLHKIHRTAHRPWGSYTILDEREGFKVKRIEVKPGASLSLQMHHKRSEHWIVVRGTAEVVNGEASLTLTANESTYIPVGAKHRLTNAGEESLELIEVQCGAYLGEDDIVRFSDMYGRA